MKPCEIWVKVCDAAVPSNQVFNGLFAHSLEYDLPHISLPTQPIFHSPKQIHDPAATNMRPITSAVMQDNLVIATELSQSRCEFG